MLLIWRYIQTSLQRPCQTLKQLFPKCKHLFFNCWVWQYWPSNLCYVPRVLTITPAEHIFPKVIFMERSHHISLYRSLLCPIRLAPRTFFAHGARSSSLWPPTWMPSRTPSPRLNQRLCCHPLNVLHPTAHFSWKTKSTTTRSHEWCDMIALSYIMLPSWILQ